MMFSLQYPCQPQGAADQISLVPALYQRAAIPLDRSNMKANILSRCDPNSELSPICICFPIPVLFLMSLSVRHTRGSSQTSDSYLG